jgi:hypothetical protein
MATDQNPATDTSSNNDGSNNDGKVTFTTEQQEKINKLIDTAVGRTASKVRGEYEAKLTDLTTQFEALKNAPKPKAGETDANADAQLKEFKTIVEQSKAETERFRQAAADREREVQSARAEAQEIRKEVAITSAASKIPFFNVDVVKTLTKDSVVYDNELKQFVVKGPNGQTRYDSTLEKPLSLEAYFTEFASQNKYLVRSEMGSGTGSSETSRQNVSSNGRFAVADIFGPKSSSQKAMQLMKDNPSEYARLKTLARSEGLIA